MNTNVDVLAVILDAWKNSRGDELLEVHAAVAKLIETTESIADHYDMDGYGPTAWKSLALEMADKARTALARVKGA